jgi:hypothetical protein
VSYSSSVELPSSVGDSNCRVSDHLSHPQKGLFGVETRRDTKHHITSHHITSEDPADIFVSSFLFTAATSPSRPSMARRRRSILDIHSEKKRSIAASKDGKDEISYIKETSNARRETRKTDPVVAYDEVLSNRLMEIC